MAACIGLKTTESVIVRPVPNSRIEPSRSQHPQDPFNMTEGTSNGCFSFRRNGDTLIVIASDDEDWEHVSVHVQARPNRCPTWAEMCWIKERFWLPTECVMQLHVPDAKHVNVHETTLHLWRPKSADIPLPPTCFV